MFGATCVWRLYARGPIRCIQPSTAIPGVAAESHRPVGRCQPGLPRLLALRHLHHGQRAPCQRQHSPWLRGRSTPRNQHRPAPPCQLVRRISESGSNGPEPPLDASARPVLTNPIRRRSRDWRYRNVTCGRIGADRQAVGQCSPSTPTLPVQSTSPSLVHTCRTSMGDAWGRLRPGYLHTTNCDGRMSG